MIQNFVILMKHHVHLEMVGKNMSSVSFPSVYCTVVLIHFIPTCFVNPILTCYFCLEYLVLKAN